MGSTKTFNHCSGLVHAASGPLREFRLGKRSELHLVYCHAKCAYDILNEEKDHARLYVVLFFPKGACDNILSPCFPVLRSAASRLPLKTGRRRLSVSAPSSSSPSTTTETAPFQLA